MPNLKFTFGGHRLPPPNPPDQRRRLKPDWCHILRKAWSMRLAAIAGLLSAAEIILPLFANDIPRGLFAGLSIAAITGAMVARVMVQKEFKP